MVFEKVCNSYEISIKNIVGEVMINMIDVYVAILKIKLLLKGF